jgi:hypothetical protein
LILKLIIYRDLNRQLQTLERIFQQFKLDQIIWISNWIILLKWRLLRRKRIGDCQKRKLRHFHLICQETSLTILLTAAMVFLIITTNLWEISRICKFLITSLWSWTNRFTPLLKLQQKWQEINFKVDKEIILDMALSTSLHTAKETNTKKRRR